MPRRKSKNNYFGKEHENAIIEYSRTKCIDRRTELYCSLIGPCLDEMVDKIVYTYKFTTLPNIEPLKEDCKVWLTTILDKYDPNKGSKAFSYFSVVTKNWFIHKIKSTIINSTPIFPSFDCIIKIIEVAVFLRFILILYTSHENYIFFHLILSNILLGNVLVSVFIECMSSSFLCLIKNL